MRHAIAWNQYTEDKLAIRVVASGGGLAVPTKLELDFETHQFRFECEVIAGAERGEFVVTLTPAAGAAVEVTAIVR